MELVWRAWARAGNLKQIHQCSLVEQLALIEPAKSITSGMEEFAQWQRRQMGMLERMETEEMSMEDTSQAEQKTTNSVGLKSIRGKRLLARRLRSARLRAQESA